MEKPSPLQQLNDVLEKTLHEKDYDDLKNDLLKEYDWLENDQHYLKMILNKLHQDGYIEFMEGEANRKSFIKNREAGNNMYIRRNFRGHLFLAQGGYVQQQINADDENNRLRRLETSQLALSRGLNVVTGLIAGGTIALVLVELWRMALDFHWFSCH